MSKLKVAVLFGGVSTEHEVSVISGVQVLNALDKNKYDILPIYITKEGQWIKGNQDFFDVKTFTNNKFFKNKKSSFISPDRKTNYLVDTPGSNSFLKPFIKEEIDVAFPIFHGRYGEDGSIQGLLEMSGIAYVGCGVTASAIGMDKMISKRIAVAIGIPTLKGNWVNKNNVTMAMEGLKFPVYIKPVHLGSSIAVTRVNNKKELDDALEVGFFYDNKILIEQGLENAKEVNISLLGNDPYEISPTEMPLSTSEVLSFKDKYLSDGSKSRGMASLKRIIPAPIKKETEKKIQEYATSFFSEIGGDGLVRMDFLLAKDEKKIYLNEINTIPGSLAFYLWKEKGMNFTKLLDKLIQLGIERKKKSDELNTIFDSNILENFGGSKGAKS
jgi:D-alanine-D-alanine ligase